MLEPEYLLPIAGVRDQHEKRVHTENISIKQPSVVVLMTTIMIMNS